MNQKKRGRPALTDELIVEDSDALREICVGYPYNDGDLICTLGNHADVDGVIP